MKFNLINWSAIQIDISNGLSLSDIKTKYKVGSSSLYKAVKTGIITNIPRKPTTESTKLKIKAALKLRPPRVRRIRPTYTHYTCIVCKIEKDIANFKFRSTKYNRRSSVCKMCDSVRASIYNAKPDIIDRKRKSKISMHETNKQYINDYLRQNPCVKCGEKDIRLLEFDHLRDKKNIITHMKYSYPMNTLIKEINKCQILCVSCHRIKSAIRQESLYNIDKKANKQYIDEFLDGGCAKCGLKDKNLLDCHHTDNNKDFDISNYIHFANIDLIKSELAKCIPLCVKCHRLEHIHDKPNHKEYNVANYEIINSDAIISIDKPSRIQPIQAVAKRLIFRDEWLNKQYLFVGCKPLFRLRPQQCLIKLLDNKSIKDFYDKYHYIGHTNNKLNIAMVFNNQIIACMSIRKPSRQNSGDWEISRMARHIDYNIYGVWSYIWNWVLSNRLLSGIVVSYSDRRLHTGNVYEKMGFIKDKYIPSDYYWVKDNIRFHKSSMRKNKEIDITENDLRTLQGFHKVWDIGKIKWVYKIED